MAASAKEDTHRDAWGYHFDWTPEHLTREQLRSMIYSYDELADECLDSLDKIASSHPAQAKADGAPPAKHHHRDFYELLVQHKDSDPKLQELWQEVNTVPDWVDWDQIDRGQQMFYRYAAPSVISLTFQSLLGGMGADRVVETLTRTGGFGAKVTRRRLLETFQHVMDVTRDLASIQPGGKGFASSVRVRLLHASVRRRILALAREKPTYYDVAKNGVPVNDLDSIGTCISFSATLVWVSLPRLGIFPREREIVDYIALWRWVAYVLGTPTEWFTTPARARTMMESLMLSEIAPTRTGQILANNIITGLELQPPTFASADFLRATTHWLNGRELADALAVPRPSPYYFVLVAGQCLFFMVLCYTYRAVPSWDRHNIARLRRYLHRETLKQTDEVEALHQFQYIPHFGQLTEMGESKKPKGGFWSPETGVERQYLGALMWGLLAVGVVGWVGVRERVLGIVVGSQELSE
ncbi:hypothetical protein GQ53DRAFT_783842 [Thozetella sp. PMI_491]|nr:hypothetical protein GQ53DRAFT_783842 [Thozetella sp. PMI_491]